MTTDPAAFGHVAFAVLLMCATGCARSLSIDGAEEGADGSGGAASTSAAGMVCAPPCADCDVEPGWSATFADLHIQGVAAAPEGGVAIAGFTDGAVELGGERLVSPGRSAIVVARLEGDGTARWSKLFGNGEGQAARGVASAPDGGVIVGGFMQGTLDFGGGPRTGDAFLVKLDAAGRHVYSHAIPAGSVGGHDGLVAVDDVAVDGEGYIAIAGALSGTLELGNGHATTADADLFVAVFDPSGALAWSRTVATGTGDPSPNVAWGPDGSVRLAASIAGTVDLGGVTASANSGVVLAAFDARGTPIGARALVASAALRASDLVTDARGHAVLTGVVEGTANLGAGLEDVEGAFVAKYDTTGELLWRRIFPGPAHRSGVRSVSTDGDGNILLIAQSAGTDFGGGALPTCGGHEGDVAIARLDACGAHVWSRTFGAATSFDVGQIALGGAGELVVAGTYDWIDGSCPLDLGDGPLPPPLHDVASYVARLHP